MSGKFAKKKTRKMKNKVAVAMVLVAIALLAAVAVLLLSQNRDTTPDETQTTQETQPQQTETQTEQTEPVVPPRQSIRNDLEVLDIGSYTGIYMEDGTDELVSGVLMMKLINNSEDTVEYARFTMDIGGETAEFTLSTLKPGATIVLLEKNRMLYDKTVDYSRVDIICENLALYRSPLELHEKTLDIQILDGAINVTNLSYQDIPGRVCIYYKNKAADVYYGGITYRITLENGLKAREIRQIMASHFSDTGSEIMFITIGQ